MRTKRLTIWCVIFTVCLLSSCKQGDAPNYYDGTKPTEAPTESTEYVHTLDDMYLTDKYLVDSIDIGNEKIHLKYLDSEVLYSNDNTPYLLVNFKLTNNSNEEISILRYFLPSIFQNKKYCFERNKVDEKYYLDHSTQKYSSSTVSQLYELENDTAPIHLEVTTELSIAQRTQVQEIKWESIKK